ncbi:MAG: transcriptional repressor [Candidatus Aminicenantes bacterium]|nr:transcriptional repressor [Candidatus Aminicenantes bacterium]
MEEREHDIYRKFQDLLSSKGVKPSFQRLLILEYIIKNKNHPSAEMIYQQISKNIPTLSRTTVYNNLNLFVKKGILTTLKTSDSESHYDIVDKPHAHFYCSVCGRIIDIDLKMPFFSRTFIQGHKIEEVKIQFLGICKKCLQ